ncbi:MAG TPA: hypothetical protein VHD83_13870 [Puia sp.]|nr:hypothetical protein [Puia sp.]
MIRALLLALSLGCLTSAMGQLKAKVKCPDLYVDVLNGTVNEQKANYGQAEINDKFPCFATSVDESQNKCGGGVFLKEKDLYFYTKRHYIEIGPKFTGKFSMPILGTKRGSLFQKLGNAKIKDDLWDAYDTSYGTLVLHYDVKGAAGKVIRIQMSTESTESLQLCE